MTDSDHKADSDKKHLLRQCHPPSSFFLLILKGSFCFHHLSYCLFSALAPLCSHAPKLHVWNINLKWGCGKCTIKLLEMFTALNGIKELHSIKTKDVGRQSSKLACNVIVRSRLRGYLRLISIKSNLLAGYWIGESSCSNRLGEGFEVFWVVDL